MTIHHLKTWPQFFEAVADGNKTFEIRKNDRHFAVDDVLVLREWTPVANAVPWRSSVPDGFYSGREVHRKVTYILQGGQWGIEEGYVVLGMVPVTDTERIAQLSADAGLAVVSKARYEALERHYQAVTRRQFRKSEEEYLVANVDAGHAWRQLQQMDRDSEASRSVVDSISG